MLIIVEPEDTPPETTSGQCEAIHYLTAHNQNGNSMKENRGFQGTSLGEGNCL